MLKEKLIAYFQSGEKQHEQFKVGAQFENVIINKRDLKTVSLHGPNGIESLLKEMAEKGWQNSDESFLMLKKNGTTITIEPGCRLKVSIEKSTSVKEIDQVYLNFLKDLFPLLEKRELFMLAIGYQPAAKIEEIEENYGQKYQLMAKYLKEKGKYALHMLKGTAGTYLTLDYAHQSDFRKKVQVAYALSPVMTALFDNSPVFEGEVYADKCLRRLIQNNCDDQRCRVAGIFNNSFGYADYAEFIMNCAPIFIKDGEKYIFTGEKTLAEIYKEREIDEKDIEHAVSMVFPEIRVKKYLEIRMADALPYPLNIAYITFWKSLLYSKDNLDALYEFIHTIKEEDIIKANQDIINEGLKAKFGEGTLLDLAKDLYFMAGTQCLPTEAHYLRPIEAIIFNGVSPREVSLRHLNEIKG
ncbi:MAG: glutamate--cysteine ligase [Clostridia bacterium]|nr:glutamate--cysteine ligase [Clostridia bacterium]